MANQKQEVVNTFEKGMNKDLNPISTPNNVLTDCLNGTIITYDGNEYHLQNDRGNISLTYSKLPKGYIPVGTTSYGDILYIVAYNPLTEKTQIGSFPSPQTRTSKKDNYSLNNNSILSATGSGVIKYTEAMENQKMQVFYGNNGDLIIYPGDKYFIEEEDKPKYSDYEKLQYFILTTEKKLIDITDQIKIGKNLDDSVDNMYYVTWDVPGYLCTQWRLPQINENGFSIQPKSVNLSTKKAIINCQIGSDDELIDNAYNNKTLGASEIIDNIIKNIFVSKDRVKYDSVNYYSTDVECEIDTSKDTFQTDLAPIIKLDENSTLLFDQFKQTSIAIDLTNVFTAGNTFIGTEYYNYSIEGNTATVNFNIDCNIVSSGEIELHIDAIPISELINNNYDCESTNLNWISTCSGNVFDGLGQNIIELKLPQEEQIYILRFQMSDGVVVPINFYKPLICSEIMNKFDSEIYPIFTSIPADLWINELNNLEIVIENTSIDSVEQTDVYAEDDCDKTDHYWSAENIDDITSFVLPESIDKLKIDSFKRGYVFKVNGVSINGIYRQKYLYNFCVCNYENSYIKILDKTIPFTTGVEKFLNNLSGDISVNCYVERKFQDQNESFASGAEFNFKEACKNRCLLQIILQQDTSASEIITSVFGYKEISKETVSCSGDFDLELEDDQDMYYFYDKNKNIKVEDGIRDDYHVDGRYYIARGCDIYQNQFVFKDAKRSLKEILSTGKVTTSIYKFMEDQEASCVPTVIEIQKNKEQHSIGIATNGYDISLYRNTNSGDHSYYVYGIMFRTYDSGPLFIPIERFTKNGNYLDGMGKDSENSARNIKAFTGWDVGFQDYLVIGPKKDGGEGTVSVGDIAVMTTTKTWWDKFKSDTDGAGIATTATLNMAYATAGVVAGAYATTAALAAIETIGVTVGSAATAYSMAIAAGATAVEAAAAASAAMSAAGTMAAAAGVSAAVPVAGWIAAGVIIVATGIITAIVKIAQNKDKKDKLIALGPFVYKPVYDVLWEFCNRIKVNIRNADFEEGFFLERNQLGEDTIYNKLNFDAELSTKLLSFDIKDTSIRISSALKFSEKLYDIFKNSLDIDWNVIERLDIINSIASDYTICQLNDKTDWPYVNPRNYEYESLREISKIYETKNSIIKEQSENWEDSLAYEFVNNGMSIGFYCKDNESPLLTSFIRLLHNTFDSDKVFYSNKNIVYLNKINADAALDTLDAWWAFSDEKSAIIKGGLDFEDVGDNPSDPRYKLFLSKDQWEFSIIGLIKENDS